MAPQVARTNGVQARAAAAAAPVDVGQLSDEQRAELAKEWGYTRLPKELPDSVTLGDVVRSLPREVRGLVGGRAASIPLFPYLPVFLTAENWNVVCSLPAVIKFKQHVWFNCDSPAQIL